MDLSFAVAWARHACWHDALIADADGVLQQSSLPAVVRNTARVTRSLAQWHAHRELHRQMLAEIEAELSNADLVVAHHRAATEGTPEELTSLKREMARRGIIMRGALRS